MEIEQIKKLLSSNFTDDEKLLYIVVQLYSASISKSGFYEPNMLHSFNDAEAIL